VIRVVLADDQALVRGGLRSILEQEPDITVVGEAGNGRQAVEVCRRLRPDVVLMDVQMPEMDGISAARELLTGPSCLGLRVVMLTTFDLDEYVRPALAAGVSGFLLKDTPAEQLGNAVRTVAEGHALLAPTVTRRLIDTYVERPAPDARRAALIASLTPREEEVLKAMADGLSNAEIARRLYLGEGTVKTHVARVLTKLGVRDRLQAVVFAYGAGLVGS
jgi:DNA-binding NarL/FixJ family response regulator